MQALLRILALAGWLLAAAGAQAQDFVVIAHPGMPKVDAPTLQRLYTGRAIEAGGVPAIPVNLAPGHPLRERFLALVVGQDNERYIAYWTVRRHVGKGVPPREFRTPAEVAEHVQATPGALGYVAAADVKPGMNVVWKP